MSSTADQARQFASTFLQMSKEIDDFRTQHFTQLTPEDRGRLEGLIQRLDDIHDSFTAAAIQATLDGIRDQLNSIAQVTTEAKQSLKHLNTVAEIIKIASAATELGQDIATGEYAAIPSAIKDLIQALPNNADKTSTGSDLSMPEK